MNLRIQNPSILGSDVVYVSSSTFDFKEPKEILRSIESLERSMLELIKKRIDISQIDPEEIIKLLSKFPRPHHINPEIFYLAYTFRNDKPEKIEEKLKYVSYFAQENKKVMILESWKNQGTKDSILFDILRYIEIMKEN